MSIFDKIEARRVLPEQCGELSEKTVHINRVARVVKGGRRFSFSALVVCGDGRGHIGFGLGKAAEVPEAIRKGSEKARKNLIAIPLRGATIPHEIVGKFGASRLVLKPAAPGTGVIAGAVVRAVSDLAGIKDLRTKCVGSTSGQNVLHACLDGLLRLDDPEKIARARNISLEELGYAPY